MEKSKSYTFKELEDFLNEWKNTNKALMVKNEGENCTAIMHVFSNNFTENWLSGDGVLFYADGEVHSADDDDVFTLIDEILF